MTMNMAQVAVEVEDVGNTIAKMLKPTKDE